MSQIKKSVREFRCPDPLWKELEQCAAELEVSIDYLVTDAIKRWLHRAKPVAPVPVAIPGPCLSIAPRDHDEPDGPLVIAVCGADWIVHVVHQSEFLIGSDPNCDLVLSGPRVGAQHARIELMHGTRYVVDLGAADGIFWSGQRIDRKRIVNGDELIIGGHRLKLRVF